MARAVPPVPARHAPVHQLRIARETDVGPEPQSLRDTGTEAFDQRVRSVSSSDELRPRSGSFRSSATVRRLRSNRLYLSGRWMPRSAVLAIDAQDRRPRSASSIAHMAPDRCRPAPRSRLSREWTQCRLHRFLIAAHCSSFHSCMRASGPPTPASSGRLDHDQVARDVARLVGGEIAEQLASSR